MAAVAIDSLEYAHQLEAVGMPRGQAEVVAKGLTTMFVHNFDALVTRDYLDTRFTEFETRIESNMERRFALVDTRFIEMETNMDRRFALADTRFIEMETSMDARCTGIETNMGARFIEMENAMDLRFSETNASMASGFANIRLEMHGDIGGVRADVSGLSEALAVFQNTQKLHSWMFALLVTGTFTLVVQNLFW